MAEKDFILSDAELTQLVNRVCELVTRGGNVTALLDELKLTLRREQPGVFARILKKQGE